MVKIDTEIRLAVHVADQDAFYWSTTIQSAVAIAKAVEMILSDMLHAELARVQA